MEPGPLSVIQIDGLTIEKLDFSKRISCNTETSGLTEGVPFEGSFGKLLAFSRFMGMSVEGFESEILALAEIGVQEEGQKLSSWKKESFKLEVQICEGITQGSVFYQL